LLLPLIGFVAAWWAFAPDRKREPYAVAGTCSGGEPAGARPTARPALHSLGWEKKERAESRANPN